MCWVTRNKAVKKVARKDIPVFKIVRLLYTDDEIAMKKVTSYFQGYEYTLGKQVECEMKIETLSSSPCIYTGFHSYDIELKKSISHVDYWRNTHIYGLDSRLIENYYTYNSAIMNCIIPVGSKYYENERGEIVSNQIKPVSIEEI